MIEKTGLRLFEILDLDDVREPEVARQQRTDSHPEIDVRVSNECDTRRIYHR